MITIYTTGPECARCEQLRKRLGKQLGTFIVADMNSPKIKAELLTNEVFVMEAPILRKQSPDQDDWYLAGQLFKDGKLDEDLLRRIVS